MSHAGDDIVGAAPSRRLSAGAVSAVETVLGPVQATELGATHIHEHVFLDLRRRSAGTATPAHEPLALHNYYEARRTVENPHSRVLDSVSEAVDELGEFARAGGRTIVEVTPICLGRRPAQLATVSRATGLNIVMGGGYYTHQYHCAEAHSLSVEELTEQMTRDCTEGSAVEDDGFGRTHIRSGVIGEIGLTWPVTDCEHRVLEAAARAQAVTGRTLIIHPGRDRAAPLAALRAVEAAGADPGRVVMSHLDRTLESIDDIAELARAGAFVAFDLFGHETSYYSHSPFLLPNDAGRLRMVGELLGRGHAHQVLMAQDICNKTHLSRYGGEGYAHILRRVVPIMEQLGMGADVQHLLLVTNPALALTGLAPRDLAALAASAAGAPTAAPSLT